MSDVINVPGYGARREAQVGQHGAFIRFTGLSGAGKSTLAHAVDEFLHQHGCGTFVLDGDNVRHGLCGDLGFTSEDRQENRRRIGEMAKFTGISALYEMPTRPEIAADTGALELDSCVQQVVGTIMQRGVISPDNHSDRSGINA
jgi:adenylylsulfate kinase-like enzyme